MAYAHITPRALDFSSDRPRAGSGRVRGFFRRIYEAFEQANQRRAEAQIANYLGLSKGKFTDELEREIERRFLSNPR